MAFFFCWKDGSSLWGNRLNLGRLRHSFGEPWGSLSFWRDYRSGHHNLPSEIATATRPTELRGDVSLLLLSYLLVKRREGWDEKRRQLPVTMSLNDWWWKCSLFKDICNASLCYKSFYLMQCPKATLTMVRNVIYWNFSLQGKHGIDKMHLVLLPCDQTVNLLNMPLLWMWSTVSTWYRQTWADKKAWLRTSWDISFKGAHRGTCYHCLYVWLTEDIFSCLLYSECIIDFKSSVTTTKWQ